MEFLIVLQNQKHKKQVKYIKKKKNPKKYFLQKKKEKEMTRYGIEWLIFNKKKKKCSIKSPHGQEKDKKIIMNLRDFKSK